MGLSSSKSEARSEATSKGKEVVWATQEEARELLSFPEGLDMVQRHLLGHGLGRYSVLRDTEAERVVEMVAAHGGDVDALAERTRVRLHALAHGTEAEDAGAMSSVEGACCAVVLGMILGDALGAPLEFRPVRYEKTRVVTTMGQEDVWGDPRFRFALKPGQWTDDSAMGLCMVDSLLELGRLVPRDLRMRWLRWYEYGYNTPFGYNPDGVRCAVGLGGNIGASFREFREMRGDATTAGSRATSGNGSVMRLASIPVFFFGDTEAAMEAAQTQSLCTHQGDEAADCARLLAFVITRCLQARDADPDVDPLALRQAVLGDALASEFEALTYSVGCLARGEAEAAHESNAHLDLADRKWTWQAPEFRYAESRAQRQPGYVGSYAMDCVAMALHCVWTEETMHGALLRAANLCGDADSVAAVVGQVSGAVWGAGGLGGDVWAWVEAVQQWDHGCGDVCLRAWLLTLPH